MSNEIPTGLAIQPVWVVEAEYGPDAAEKRRAVRVEHLTRMDQLRERGVVIEVGGFTDMSGSLIMLHAPSEEAALELMREDV